MPICPCGTGLDYEACCGPYHARVAEPATPEALMRSRYAAFGLGELEYLWATLHEAHDDRAIGRDAYLAELRKGAARRRYKKLAILGTRGPDRDGVSLVLFAVTLAERGKDRSFVELSRFAHDGRGYRYLFGTTKPRSACPRDLGALGIDEFLAL